MIGLNKKLSELIEDKTLQLKSSSLKYILSICFLAVSLRSITGGNPYLDTFTTFGMFWILLSADEEKRIYIYLSAILVSVALMNQMALITGLILASSIVILSRLISDFTANEDIALAFLGFLSHVGDLLTTSVGLTREFSENNPFIQHLGIFTDISAGLIASKTALFLFVGYLMYREVEGLNSLLKLFLASGFFLTLANLNVILSGM